MDNELTEILDGAAIPPAVENEQIILYIDPLRIDPHPEQAKIYGKTTITSEFRESIRERGILTPCLVTPAGPDGRRRMISGHSRQLAAVELNIPLPCYEKEYDSSEDETLDLIHSNRGRIKTEAQINREILALKRALSEGGKARARANLTGAGVPTDSPTGDKSPVGRTNEEIASRMGISKDEVKARALVHDDELRAKFFDKMRAAGARDAMIDELREAWDVVRQQQEGGLKLTPAEQQIKAMQKEYLERCPANKNKAKTEKPEKESKPKRKSMPYFRPRSSGEGFEHLGYSRHLDRDFEIGITRVGEVISPAVSIDGAVFVIDTPRLVEHIFETI